MNPIKQIRFLVPQPFATSTTTTTAPLQFILHQSELCQSHHQPESTHGSESLQPLLSHTPGKISCFTPRNACTCACTFWHFSVIFCDFFCRFANMRYSQKMSVNKQVQLPGRESRLLFGWSYSSFGLIWW